MNWKAWTILLCWCLVISFGRIALVHSAETMSKETLDEMIKDTQDPLARSVLQGIQISWQLKEKIEKPLLEKDAQVGDYSLKVTSGLQVQPSQVTAGLKVNF